MKRVVFLLLVAVLALTACASPVPTEPPAAASPEPSPTPVVVIQTVLVEPTQPPPTEVPPTPVPPTPQPIVVTVVVEPTQAPAAQPAAPTAAANAPITLDPALGKGVFTNMTISSANLTLRCAPREVVFNITTSNPDIVDVLFFYRIMDLKRLYQKDYKNFGKMTANGNGNFTLVFKGEDVHPNLRIDGSWLDFQFVGLAKSGNVVDRSQTIESQIKYTFDCP
ncbi:MAG: hypothetical protein AB1509_16865 [Chloroflexota bacterium]